MLGFFWRLRRSRIASPVATGLEVKEIRSLAQAEIEARHPVTGDALGAFFVLASPDNPLRRQARLEISRAGRGQADLSEEEAAERLNESAADFLSRIVLNWRGVKEDGVPMEFSPGAAHELFARDELRWLVNQLLHEAARTENFIAPSAPG